MGKSIITEKKAKETPAGGVLVGKREGQTIIHDKGTEGGYFVGRLHKEGGIKGINKSTGQPIEVQGGEVIITAPAVADQTKREFEGEMLTNREILSKINERGGGVSLENGGEILINGTAYNYGGMTMTDYEIMQKMNECGCDDEYDDGGSLSKGKKIEWLKNFADEGWSSTMENKNAYESVGGYISSSKKWKIYRKGRWYYDKINGQDSFIRDGDWLVYHNDEFYGNFDSLKEAKIYVENWVRIRPKDYSFGGKTMTDYEIMQSMNDCGCDYDDNDDDDDFEYEFKKGGSVVTYKNKYNKKYGYSKDESHSLEEISKDTGVSLAGLQQIYNKGIGAYKTNPSSVRPNVKSKEQWAMARVYSAVMGGKASKVDSNELVMENGGNVDKNNLLAGGLYYYKNQYMEEPIVLKLIEKQEWSNGNIESLIFKKQDNSILTLKENELKYLFIKKPEINADDFVKKFNQFIQNKIGYNPQKSLNLIDLIDEKKSNGTFKLYFIEEVKDGRSSKFNINLPLNLKNKSFYYEGVLLKISNIKYLGVEEQESESDSRYLNYSYFLDIKLNFNKNSNIRFEDGGLIAPNGKPSNLNAEQYKIVRTPEFKAWFGDWENDPKNASKVVDENGEPLVVYHGTNKVFNSFKKELKAHYFAVDIKYANFVTKEYKGVEKELARIIPAFLNIRKLQRVNFPIEKSSVSAYLSDHKFLKQVDGGIYGFDDIEESLFDKIQDIDTRVYVCFNPDQIKIADGTNTTFNSNTDDIRYDDGGSVKTPTQFWGNVAGGALIYCTTTKRFLILKRSQYVLEPNTWGIISGKMDDDETSIEKAVIREVKEETNYDIKDLYPSYVFKKGSFTFYNYIAFVDREFNPKLNWENVDYRWVKLKDFPENLHFGLKLLIENEDLENVEKNINELAFLDDADSFFDDGGRTTSKNKKLFNQGTDGVIGGALIVPFSDAVVGFDATNGAGTIAGFELSNMTLGTNMGNNSQIIAENGTKINYSDGGSTKELVDFLQITDISKGIEDPSNNLIGTKYYSLEELLKDIYDSTIKIKKIYKSTYITLGVNGDTKKTFYLNLTTGRNSSKRLSIKNANKKYFIEQNSYTIKKYDFDKWLEGKSTPKTQPEPIKDKATSLNFKIFDLEDGKEITGATFFYISSLYDSLKTIKKNDSKDVGVVVDLYSNGIFIGSNNFYLLEKNKDFKHFNIEQIPLDIFERLFVNYFPDIDLSELFDGRFVEGLSFQERTDFFSQQTEPIKEEEKKVEKIDFEATKKYLNLRIATLTKELNFKKPRLSNEEIGFFQRDINTLIQKLRNINERYLEFLPLKERLENAYSLKWGSINAVYEPAKELLAPNGLPTKLTEKEWLNVRYDSFSSFFGDWQLANEIGDFSGVSKVIDPDTKEPMPVYHGTNVLFTEWKTYKSNNAHYFAKERDFSIWFAEQWSKGRGDISARDSNLLKQLNPNKGEYVYRCFLDIKNPIDFSRFGVEKRPVSDFLMFLQINYNIGDFDFWTNFRLFNNLAQDTLVYSWMIIRNWQSFTEYVKLATTYDGYIFYEYHPEKVGTGLEGASLSYCTFDSSQVKFTNSTEFNSLITDSRFNFGGIL